jgi:two-component system NarL family sensor kinase
MSDVSDAAKLRQRNRELAILNEIAQALNRSVDLRQTLQAVLAQVAILLDLKTGWIWLRHEESEASYLAAAQNLPPALTSNPQWMAGDCYCLRTFREDDLEGAANTNVVECSRLHGLVDGTDGLRYHASIPLYAHGKKLGVMNAVSTGWRRLAADDLQLLDTIGDMLSIAVERARLFDHSVRLGALEERNRLAREIHDTLAQGLTAVSLQLESADVQLESGADVSAIRQTVQRALQLTRTNLDDARRSVLDLRASLLQGRTLPEALVTLARQAQVPAEFFLIGDNRRLSPRIESGLFRIAQEALANVERHADASSVKIRLHLLPESVRLEVEDDGRGFELEQVPPNRYGLVGMNERANLLNGRLHLESSPGAGTYLEATVPV